MITPFAGSPSRRATGGRRTSAVVVGRRLAADPRSLGEGRGAVRGALRRQGWGLEAAELVVLAVCEALTNAIEHGSRPGDPVRLEVVATPRRARVRVIDRGGDDTAPPRVPPPPPSSSERGRGLIIISALADGLELRGAGRGTEVRMDFASGADPTPAAESVAT